MKIKSILWIFFKNEFFFKKGFVKTKKTKKQKKQKKQKSIKLKFLKQNKKYYINPNTQFIKCQESPPKSRTRSTRRTCPSRIRTVIRIQHTSRIRIRKLKLPSPRKVRLKNLRKVSTTMILKTQMIWQNSTRLCRHCFLPSTSPKKSRKLKS